jgi:hypothetical protein
VALAIAVNKLIDLFEVSATDHLMVKTTDLFKFVNRFEGPQEQQLETKIASANQASIFSTAKLAAQHLTGRGLFAEIQYLSHFFQRLSVRMLP